MIFLVSLLTATEGITNANAQLVAIKPGWKVLQLPYGWTLNVPNDFKAKRLQGVDSEPGVVRSRRRKIKLEYDIIAGGVSVKRKPDCDTTQAVILWIGIENHDDWRGREISTAGIECRNDTYIGLKGTNLGEKGEQLTAEIFETLRINYSDSALP
ncbi:MAG: hypothetical protein M3Y54_10660 [Bacteroidota bacterium]|nr:hypothetical protein [Bacteroidota bacterium]